MKRRMLVTVICVVAMGMAGCGGESDGGSDSAGLQPRAMDVAAARAKCADARLEQNLTPEQFATEREKITAEDADRRNLSAEDKQLALGLTMLIRQEPWLSLLRSTPPGGQGRYARDACLPYTRQFPTILPPENHLTVILESGYLECVSLKSIDDDPASHGASVDPGTARAIEELRQRTWEMRAATRQIRVSAQKNLCPQYPLDELGPSPASTPPGGGCEDVTLPGPGARPGTISVKSGDVSCVDANKVIVESWKQLVSEGAKGVYYEVNGVTEYICNIAGAAVSDSEGYDYKCESPTGDKAITWTENE